MDSMRGAGPHRSRAHELLALTLEGAHAKDRPDLIRRLTGVRQGLDDLAVRDTAKADEIAAGEALRALGSLEADLRAQRALHADPGHANRLRAELGNAKARSDRFAGSAREWQFALGDGFASVNSDLEFHLRASTRAVLASAETAINSGDPARRREEFAAWLSQRLVHEADAAYRKLYDGAHRMATQLAGMLELRAPHRFGAPQVVAPNRLVAELPDRPPTDMGSVPIPARLLTVVMPSYGGIMMALVTTHFLGIGLPGWVLGVLAGGGALVLGGASFSGERKRQLDRRRIDAVNAVRIELDEFQLALGKQIRDAARTLQQELRHATTAAVGARFDALGEELDSLRGAEADATKGAAGLDDLDADLHAVIGLRDTARRMLSSARATGSTGGRVRTLRAVEPGPVSPVTSALVVLPATGTRAR